MRRFLPVIAFTLVAAPVTAAQDTKPPAPKTVAEAKKQIAEFEALFVKKKAELEKAEAALKKAEAVLKKVREAGQAKVTELRDTLVKALDGPQAKLREADETAKRAAAVEADAVKAAGEVEKKLRAATDPKEVEELKKKLADLDVVVKQKRTEAVTASLARTAAEFKLTEVRTVIDVALRQAAVEADKAIQEELKVVAVARRETNTINDELESAAINLRRAQERLRILEGK